MKDYCKQILGKSIREITIEDLKSYFLEKKEETEILEFKSGLGDFEKTFTNNILRAVTAFLNSSGGLIIWGSPEDKVLEKGLPKVCIGDLVPVTERKEKDQLINRISSSISYMPTGILVERIDITNGFIYIIEVQESSSKPHQLNGQYFIRLDGQSKPAPHYFVDSMFNQIKQPDIDGRIKFKNVEKQNNEIAIISLDIMIFNKSQFINEKNISFQLVASPGIIIRSNKYQYFSEAHKVLHYGMPYQESHVIRIDDLAKYKKMEIMLSFGGELGLAKINSYEIDVTKLNNGAFDFKNYVIKHEENKSFKEKSEELGKTHEDKLKILLNRE